MTDSFEDKYTVEELEPQPEGAGVTLDDFVAYMPSHSYIFMPCREFWPASSVNARVPPVPVLDANGKPKQHNGKPIMIPASAWLDQNRAVEQMTWCPGMPTLIPNRLVVDAGWIEREGVANINLYREPRIQLGDARKAEPCLELAHTVFNDDDAHHVIQWLAHRVQHPQEKINHALVIGSETMGIGKDSLLEPVRHAVGPWNFQDIKPQTLLGEFNGFVKSVILRVSEARDLGEFDRFSFYDHVKTYTAAPPYTLRVNQKFVQEYYVFNCTGLIITTNYKTDGIYLPAEDRRNYVAWSDRRKEDYPPDYWNELYRWYEDGGFGHVAAYLAEFDLTDFDPKAPPPKTPAFWQIVGVNTPQENAELADVVDALGNPDALTLAQLMAAAKDEAADWLMNRGNRRTIPHRLERCGYLPVRNPDAPSDGLWKINGRRAAVYVKKTLKPEEQLRAARDRRHS
jgi:Family of unknown function (DUF5906)